MKSGKLYDDSYIEKQIQNGSLWDAVKDLMAIHVAADLSRQALQTLDGSVAAVTAGGVVRSDNAHQLGQTLGVTTPIDAYSNGAVYVLRPEDVTTAYRNQLVRNVGQQLQNASADAFWLNIPRANS